MMLSKQKRKNSRSSQPYTRVFEISGRTLMSNPSTVACTVPRRFRQTQKWHNYEHQSHPRSFWCNGIASGGTCWTNRTPSRIPPAATLTGISCIVVRVHLLRTTPQCGTLFELGEHIHSTMDPLSATCTGISCTSLESTYFQSHSVWQFFQV
jgi:hypothetical protein